MKIAKDNPGSTSLSRLRVDSNNRLIGAPDIEWVEREVWELPKTFDLCLR